MSGRLSARDIHAINAYFANGRNKTQAMIEAGFPESSARKNCTTYFKKPQIVAEIERRELALQDRYEITREWIVERLAKIADSGRILAKFKKVDAQGNLYWDFTDATPEDLEVINSLTVDEYKEGRGPDAEFVKRFKIDSMSPQAALDSLARILGLNQDKLKIEGDETLVNLLMAGRKRVKQHRLAAPQTEAEDAEFEPADDDGEPDLVPVGDQIEVEGDEGIPW